jgi:hypothetical protein
VNSCARKPAVVLAIVAAWAVLVLLVYAAAGVHGLVAGRYHWSTAHIAAAVITAAAVIPPKRRR